MRIRCLKSVAAFLLTVLVALWVGCSPMGDHEDSQDDRRRPGSGRGGGDDDFRGGDSSEEENNGDSGFFAVGNDDNNDNNDNNDLELDPSTNLESTEDTQDVGLRRRDQTKKLSRKIDFLFFVDGSKHSHPFLTPENIDSKFNSFIAQLKKANVNWRFYFISAAANENSKKPLNNGEPSDLERDGAFILDKYLSLTNLEPYNLQDSVHSVFVDTLSHNNNGDRRRDACRFPPFCHSEKDTRPLRAFHKFLSRFANSLRDDADLVSVIISAIDEARLDRKNGPMDASLILDSFNEKFPSDKNFFAVSIVVKVGEQAQCGTKFKAASHIPQLSLLTRGTVINICNTQQDGYGKPIIDFLKKK